MRLRVGERKGGREKEGKERWKRKGSRSVFLSGYSELHSVHLIDPFSQPSLHYGMLSAESLTVSWRHKDTIYPLPLDH